MIRDETTVYADPGVKYVGWACFHTGRLISAGYTRREDFADLVAPLAMVGVIEMPWGIGKSTTEQDILRLTLAAGEYGGRFRFTRYERPISAPKPVRHAQALKRLSAAELTLLPKQKTHLQHTLCAVWMGLRDSGRMI